LGFIEITMRLQKQLSKRTKDRDYHRFVIVIPNDLIEKAEFKEGDSLEAVDIKRGEIKLKRAQKP
jgi:hypothetical protein